MPTLSRCIGTKVSRVRASSDRVGRPLGWTGLIITPLQRKPGLALLFRQPTIGSAPSLRAPGILRTPLPIRPRSLRFYLTPIKCTCTLQFGNFSTIYGKRLTKLPRMLLPAGNPATPPVSAHDGSFASGTLYPGETYQVTFYEPRTYTYQCSDTMQGSVTVI